MPACSPARCSADTARLALLSTLMAYGASRSPRRRSASTGTFSAASTGPGTPTVSASTSRSSASTRATALLARAPGRPSSRARRQDTSSTPARSSATTVSWSTPISRPIAAKRPPSSTSMVAGRPMRCSVMPVSRTSRRSISSVDQARHGRLVEAGPGRDVGAGAGRVGAHVAQHHREVGRPHVGEVGRLRPARRRHQGFVALLPAPRHSVSRTGSACSSCQQSAACTSPRVCLSSSPTNSNPREVRRGTNSQNVPRSRRARGRRRSPVAICWPAAASRPAARAPRRAPTPSSPSCRRTSRWTSPRPTCPAPARSRTAT